MSSSISVPEHKLLITSISEVFMSKLFSTFTSSGIGVVSPEPLSDSGYLFSSLVFAFLQILSTGQQVRVVQFPCCSTPVQIQKYWYVFYVGFLWGVVTIYLVPDIATCRLAVDSGFYSVSPSCH